MAVYYGWSGLQAAMERKVLRLRQSTHKSASNAATYVQAQAVAMAPVKTGETMMSITKEPVGAGHYQIISATWPKGRTGFMQNFWANRTEPFRAVKMSGWPRNRHVSYDRITPTVYGDGSHNTTGTPEFFHKAYLLGRVEFPKILIREIHEALGA